ncbi:MAG: hypothetical protein B7Y43_00370 [Sphingomonas sp. 28-62-20]|uniref:YoaK family protein n=1 Tax=Sphingomonas sp. 28-62-20 TaxID=1970433 RepID=UPI000BC4D3C9|nr:MAG: hypothetical protein B7Y43_00370 [Sphingomonas sp. 28-62-20]
MHRYGPRIRLFAAAASSVAGFVDAVGFVALGGFFVSFMSGNTTRLGVGLAYRGHDGAIAIALIAIFVIGVVLGSLVGHRAGARRQPAVLLLVALLLAAAALLHGAGWHRPGFVAMALAMGAENAVFERDGEIRIGLTYMTGTLVKLGQRLAMALMGGDRFGWLPYLAQWSALAAGAALGALSYPLLGLAALWPAAFVCACLAAISTRISAD